jgi:hypothetical protein
VGYPTRFAQQFGVIHSEVACKVDGSIVPPLQRWCIFCRPEVWIAPRERVFERACPSEYTSGGVALFAIGNSCFAFLESRQQVAPLGIGNRFGGWRTCAF